MTWIAEEPLVFLFPNGRRVDGRIAIGLPYEDEGHSRCAMALEPLLSGTRATHGEGKLQALVAALRLAGSQLDAFLKDGGRILWPPGDDPDDSDTDVDFAIEAVLGPLLVP